jgi:hypothetical protein
MSAVERFGDQMRDAGYFSDTVGEENGARDYYYETKTIEERGGREGGRGKREIWGREEDVGRRAM